MTVAAQTAVSLKRTPLHSLHIELGARMVPFAGYEMPVQYTNGILNEHRHVRAAAGLFDVSHMGQLAVRARGAETAHAAAALESVVPVDLLGLAPGRQRYALLTNQKGGICDDLMIARMDDRLVVVTNAARNEADENYLRMALADRCDIERLDSQALLALQGPMAQTVLETAAAGAAEMKFMDVRPFHVFGIECIVSRSGYTGEDGFEISVPSAAAESLARRLLENPYVAMVGLGARDSLRLEAGLCLFGSDLDSDTTLVEAGLEWSVQASRRSGGSRAGGFPGAAIVLDQIKNGAPRRRVGLRPDGRAPIRHGTLLFHDRESRVSIGVVTSGGFGPSINAPIAMGYVTSEFAEAGAEIFAELRGERVLVRVTKLPFITPRYKR